MIEPYLAVTVLDDQQHGCVQPLHDSIQGLNAHAMLGCAIGKSPGVANGPGREVLGQLHKRGGTETDEEMRGRQKEEREG